MCNFNDLEDVVVVAIVGAFAHNCFPYFGWQLALSSFSFFADVQQKLQDLHQQRDFNHTLKKHLATKSRQLSWLQNPWLQD